MEHMPHHFTFRGRKIRMILHNNELRFCLKDVGIALMCRNIHQYTRYAENNGQALSKLFKIGRIRMVTKADLEILVRPFTAETGEMGRELLASLPSTITWP